MKKQKLSREECDECGGKLELRSLPYNLKGTLIGNFPTEVCTKCGEKCYTLDVSKEITKAVKEKGLWGIESTTRVNKIGDSLGVIINKKIIDFLGLKKGELVKVYPEGKNKIIIEI